LWSQHPNAADTVDALNANTTQHLIADIEALRMHLAVDRWLVMGASWGSVLGLAYAQAHPASVSELVLFSVVGGSAREVEWATRGMGQFFPEEWQRFQAGVPEPERDGDLSAAYYRLLLIPILPSTRRRHATGASGMTARCVCPASRPRRAIKIPRSGSASHGWSPTIGVTVTSCPTGLSRRTQRAWLVFQASSSVAPLTSAARLISSGD
jgi:pimeloyl-ACP methyl ester carboxylesterase